MSTQTTSASPPPDTHNVSNDNVSTFNGMRSMFDLTNEHDAKAYDSVQRVLKTYNKQAKPAVHIETEKAVHKAMCLLKAQGYTNREIARELGYTPEWVSNVARQPWFVEQLGIIQASIGYSSVKKAIDRSADEAFEVIYDLMHNAEKETVRLECARDILNRHIGKPPQTVEVNTKSLVQYEDITAIDNELREINEQLRRIEGH